MIKGGYYIKARAIQESDIAHASPCVREIWDYLIREANHQDTKVAKRGQLIRRISQIQEALSWLVGYRKEMYSQDQCEKAMKWLAKQDMIVKTKTVRGLIITICNYDFYQSPENYEGGTAAGNKAGIKRQSGGTINKNVKNGISNTGEGAAAPAPVLNLKTEIDEQYEKFNIWLDENAATVRKMKQPITLEQYQRLKADFNTPALKKLLFQQFEEMGNWAKLSTKNSANATVRKWAKKVIDENPSFYLTTSENGTGTGTANAGGKTSREKQGEEILGQFD